MKKCKVLLLLTVVSVLLFTGCSSEKYGSSYMVRTVGVGESAMPIGDRDFAVELFTDKATSVDVISVNKINTMAKDLDEYYITSGKDSKENRNYGVNFRLGFGNYTEVKLGLFAGRIYDGNESLTFIDESGNKILLNRKFDTSFRGVQLGLKRLLTDYSNPHKISLYLETRYISTQTEGLASKYDGNNIELKPALIYGYLKDPTSRNFPSFSLYYSLANTKRDNSVAGIKAKKSPQAVGAEANLNLSHNHLYANIAAGVEKEISDKTTNKLKPYLGVKVGFHIKKYK